MKTLAVIGGGAAGLAAAIAAGRQYRALLDRSCAQRLNIVVYERDDRVGRSILATGNGRCNFSNSNISPACYHHKEFVASALEALEYKLYQGATNKQRQQLQSSNNPVVWLFANQGLAWREEADGRLYPKPNKASVVLDVLRAAAKRLGVREVCNAHVDAIEPPRAQGKPYTLRMSDGAFNRADAVIVAVGGKGATGIAEGFAAQDKNLPFTALRPVLGPLKTNTDSLRGLNNIRVRCVVSLMRSHAKGEELIAREAGELMFRTYGVSGIAVFNLSRFAQPKDLLYIDFINEYQTIQNKSLEETKCEAERQLQQRRKRLAAQFDALTCEDYLRGLVLPLVGQQIVQQAASHTDALRADTPCTKSVLPALADALLRFPLTVEGIVAKQSQVQRGGFSPSAIDGRTLEARTLPGLYLAGEAVDVDGPCGGYNLHWAWASGLLAGMCAVERLIGAECLEEKSL